MLSARALSRALRALEGEPFEGTLCRAVHPATLYGFAKGPAYKPKPLFSFGSPLTGARFTPKGGAPALYLAENQVTALAEFVQVGGHVPLTPTLQPSALVVYPVEVKIQRVLDVTRRGVQRLLGTNAKELASAWRFRRDGKKPPTHVLGAAVAKSGAFDGLRFQSTKGPGACLVVFTAAVKPPAFVRIRDPQNNLVEQLP